MGRPTNFNRRIEEARSAQIALERRALINEWSRRYRVCPATAQFHPGHRLSCGECEGTGCAKMAAKGLDDKGEALPFAERPHCGAITRQLFSCRNRVLPGKMRCHFHGGLSTGPNTAEGKERIAAAQRLRWARWRAAKSSI